MTFNDSNDLYHTPTLSSSSIPREGSDNNVPTSPITRPAPAPPPRPPKKLGIDRIAEIQALRGQFNEVTVENEGSVEDYGQYCANLFQDDAMLFVTILSDGADQVPKVLQVVEETKRIRHKAGLEEELHQYVLYDTQVRKGPKRINLDDTSNVKNKYAPPESLTVHLSKIPMPELQPQVKSVPDNKPSPPVLDAKETKKEQKKREEAKRKEDKKVTPPPSPNKLTRPGRESAHKAYFHNPSPSQINNPSIYVAPPPIPARSQSPEASSHSRTPSTIVAGLFDMLHRPRSAS